MIGGPTSRPGSRAVDGNTETSIRFCTHTDGDYTNPWFRVDLGQVEPVNEVYIVNRGGCCGDRLNPFEIRVGKTKLHEALLKIIIRFKPRKMDRTKFSNQRAYYKHCYPFDDKPTYLLTRKDSSQSFYLIATEQLFITP